VSCQPFSPSREGSASRFSEESTSISFHGTYAPFVFILLRTLLHGPIRYLQSFHHLPHSLPKTPGVGTGSHGTHSEPARLLASAVDAAHLNPAREGWVTSTPLPSTVGAAQVSSLYPDFASATHLSANLFRMRTSEKSTRNPFGIRTSKTQHLKSFRMRISEKNRGGHPIFIHPLQVGRPFVAVSFRSFRFLTTGHRSRGTGHVFCANGVYPGPVGASLRYPFPALSFLGPNSFISNAYEKRGEPHVLAPSRHGTRATVHGTRRSEPDMLSSVGNDFQAPTPIPSLRRSKGKNGRAPRTRWTDSPGRRTRSR
jgi:hypothetical protein